MTQQLNNNKPHANSAATQYVFKSFSLSLQETTRHTIQTRNAGTVGPSAVSVLLSELACSVKALHQCFHISCASDPSILLSKNFFQLSTLILCYPKFKVLENALADKNWVQHSISLKKLITHSFLPLKFKTWNISGIKNLSIKNSISSTTTLYTKPHNQIQSCCMLDLKSVRTKSVYVLIEIYSFVYSRM